MIENAYNFDTDDGPEHSKGKTGGSSAVMMVKVDSLESDIILPEFPIHHCEVLVKGVGSKYCKGGV